MFIRNLKNYPENGEHQEVHGHNIPCIITKGEDHHKRNKLWYVHFEYPIDVDINQGFHTPEDAIEKARNKYKKWLNNELKRVA